MPLGDSAAPPKMQESEHFHLGTGSVLLAGLPSGEKKKTDAAPHLKMSELQNIIFLFLGLHML